jgi:2-polyprenyl-3-methyl-5-hydroxy-6-metoxy-1,4-benzoquinol methylase
MNQPREYSLGYSDAEAQRLTKQAALFEDLTEDVLRRAGLVHGMDVLDVGCGVGDVSFLAGRMVGPSGSVLGVDRSSSSVAIARKRFCQEATNLQFDIADLDAFDTTRMFDAVIGRMVLCHLPDPAATLRRLCHFVRPTGIIAFQEMDESASACVPEAALHSRAGQWILRAASAAGREVDTGSKLYSLFVKAGLPRPTMIAAARVEGGPQSSRDDSIADVIRSLLPIILRFGIASEEEIRIETLAERLREESATTDCVSFGPRLVGAWSRL